jgi:ZIP family zinc transporter
VLEATWWGFVAASTLVVGAVLAMALPWPSRAIGLVAGFGAGALISAVTLDLTASAFEVAGVPAIVLGLSAGAIVFSAGNWVLHRGGVLRHRKRSSGQQAGADPLGIVLGTVLDGIPESVVIGLSLLAGAPPEIVATIQTFAAGAVLTMLADTMMPEAFEEAGQAVGLATVLGYAVGALLTLV